LGWQIVRNLSKKLKHFTFKVTQSKNLFFDVPEPENEGVSFETSVKIYQVKRPKNLVGPEFKVTYMFAQK